MGKCIMLDRSSLSPDILLANSSRISEKSSKKKDFCEELRKKCEETRRSNVKMLGHMHRSVNGAKSERMGGASPTRRNCVASSGERQESIMGNGISCLFLSLAVIRLKFNGNYTWSILGSEIFAKKNWQTKFKIPNFNNVELFLNTLTCLDFESIIISKFKYLFLCKALICHFMIMLMLFINKLLQRLPFPQTFQVPGKEIPLGFSVTKGSRIKKKKKNDAYRFPPYWSSSMG